MSRLVIVTGFAAGLVVGLEPIWAGQWLDFAFPAWPFPLGIAVLLAVASGVWWGWQWRADVSARRITQTAVVSIVVGGMVGFSTTLLVLSAFIVPPLPGHIGYLPGWPWQVLGWVFTHRLIPGVVGLGLWATLVGAAKARVAAGITARHS